MGTGTITPLVNPDQIIDNSHHNGLASALIGDFVGRNTNGVAESGKSLGTFAIPWGVLRTNSLVVNGQLIDPGTISTPSNSIVTGRTRATSDLTDFIRADGATNAAVILGLVTNLVTVINTVTATVNTDLVLSGLVGAPGSQRRCSVNDTSFVGQLSTQYAGEDGTSIIVDGMQNNLIDKIGQIVCLRNQNVTEYMVGFIRSTTEITNISRGFFFDDNGDPIVRQPLNNNDELHLMSLGWVFLQDDGLTTDVSYNSPIYDFVAPSSPITGDYWFDLQIQTWKRFDGVSFLTINRILIGVVVIDDSNLCVASRSVDFDLDYDDLNTINFASTPETTEIIRSETNNNEISVNAKNLEQRTSFTEFNITTDRDTGVVESPNTVYYSYISQDGQNIISDEKPHSFDALKRGFYHPYQSWRNVNNFFNDGSSNITSVTNITKDNSISQSLTTNGFRILEGGLIMQWGTVTGVGGNATVTVNLPITHPNATLNVVANLATTNAAIDAPAFGNFLNNSQIQVTNSHSVGGQTITWQTIGF